MIAKPIIFDAISVRGILAGLKTQTRRVIKPQPDKTIPAWFECPYGFHSQSLWVREAWYVQPELWQVDHDPQPVEYAECSPANQVEDYVLKPAMFMPRWASRITLEITDVRVQRLQCISELDCEAELGVAAYAFGNAAYGRFRDRWESINAKRKYPWRSDPWVWALTFKLVQP